MRVSKTPDRAAAPCHDVPVAAFWPVWNEEDDRTTMGMDCTLSARRADAIHDSSDFSLLGYFKCIVHFYTQISDGAFKSMDFST